MIALLLAACSSGSEKPRTAARNPIVAVTATDAAPTSTEEAPTTPAVPLPGVDREGNPLPLPARVSAQLGTLRLHHGSDPTWIEWSPDGSQLMTAGEQTIRVWSVSDGALAREVTAAPLGIDVAAMSPNGDVVGGGPGKLIAWDKSGRELWRVEVAPEEVVDLAFSPDGKLVAAATLTDVRGVDDPPPSRGLWLVELATGKEILDLKRTDHPPELSVAFSRDGKLVAVSGNGTHVYDVASGKRVATVKGGGSGAAFTPDERAIVWAEDFDIVRYDRKTKKEKRRRLVKDDEVLVEALALSPDGATLLAFRQGKVHVLDPSTLADQQVFDVPTPWVSHASFAPDGKRIAVAGSMGIRILDVAAGSFEPGPPGHGSGVSIVAFSPDGTRVVTGGDDGAVLLWDLEGELVATAPPHLGTVRGVSFSVDGSQLVSCASDGRVIVSRVSDGAEVARVDVVSDGPCDDVLFLEDGRVLIAPGASTGLVWSPGGEAPVPMPYEIEEGLEAFARSPDGKLVLAAQFLLDASTLELVREIETGGLIKSAAFSHDSAMVLIGHEGGLELVEVATGKQLATLGFKSHSGVVWGVGDRWIATAGEHGAAILTLDRATWTVAVDAPLDYPGHHGTRSVDVSPDGSRIVTSHDNGVALIWAASAR